MPKQVRLRRGTTAQHSAFTGAEGEVTMDTDKKTLVVHDGVTAGGRPLDGFVKLTPATALTQQTISGPLNLVGGDAETYGLSVANAAIFSDVTINNLLQVKRDAVLSETLAYSASVLINFGTYGVKRITLAGNITFTGSGYSFNGKIRVKITGDGSLRTLTFPAGWKFLGAAAPANIAANKVGQLELWSDGVAESDVTARWSVQP